MRVRDWQDVLDEVTDGGHDADGWRAVAGNRPGGLGEEMVLGHPAAGVFMLKTYAKNPREVRGVGARVARKVDGDIDPMLPSTEATGRFAVQRPPADEDDAETMAERVAATVESHREVPEGPTAFFEDLMDAVDSPAFGPMEYEFDSRPKALDEAGATFEEAAELLDSELDDLIEEDEVGRGFA